MRAPTQSGTHQRMVEQTTRWEADRDLRCVFLGCYGMMTDNMLLAIGDGRFHDPAWVERLLHRFADYYFDALDLYEGSSANTPAVWRQAHDAACGCSAAPLRLLMAGVNAHINYDLVLTLRDMLKPEWAGLSEDERRRRYEDHCLVNAVIAETIDAVQDEVVERHEPWLNLIDVGLGPIDEWLTARLIRNWRESVWEQAVELLAIEETAADCAYCSRVEADVLKRGQQILG